MSKVYALLASGDIVEGVENVDNVTKPKSVQCYHDGRKDTRKPIASWSCTPENYEKLVVLFGSENVQKPEIDYNGVAREYLAQNGCTIGKVSDESTAAARLSEEYHIVCLGSDDTFFVGYESWKHCVLYDSKLREIKPRAKQPAVKAGDYVTCASNDLEDISDYRYIVVHNGEELVIIDDSGAMRPIIEGLEMGHFKRIEKE